MAKPKRRDSAEQVPAGAQYNPVENSKLNPPESGAAVPQGPIGGIVAWAGTRENVPKNWLICDGRALPRTQPYKPLFDAIGTTWGGDAAGMFLIPNLMGTFLRGVDLNRDGVAPNPPNDPDRDNRSYAAVDTPNPGNRGNAVGSRQDHMLQSHFHNSTFNTSNNTHDADGGGEKFNSDGERTRGTTGALGANVGGETRPRNAYVYWIIRAY